MNSLLRIFGSLVAVVILVSGVLLFESRIIGTRDGSFFFAPRAAHDLAATSSVKTETSGALTTTKSSTVKESVNVAHPTKGVTPVAMDSTPRPTAQTPSAQSVSVPGPLVVQKAVATTSRPDTASDAPLNEGDIVAITNRERASAGLPPLSFNATLATMATAKANDMIQKQYFAHVSPDGTDLTMLAKRYGYLYLNVGENLALGDFTSSADVMNGWMNSPGHRANILNKNFTEIGVSAVFGNYAGRNVWYAVQEFGRPLSDCTLPDPALKTKIETYQTEIASLQASLTKLEADIRSADIDPATYDQKASEYNSLVGSYNELVRTLKADIQTYNTQVEAYNTCAGN